MKKLIAMLVMASCACSVAFSQEVKMSITGEVKTGLFWYSTESDDPNATGGTFSDKGAFIHNTEDDNWQALKDMSGLRGSQGLYRLNFDIIKGNLGAKFRFETTSWQSTSAGNTEGAAYWGYAFLYGNFFNNQFRFSAGKLGDSPWGSGDELQVELDNTMGMRFEYMPTYIPGLDIGFVLNDWNTPAKANAEFIDLLSETVLGLSYTHDYFHLRFAYRLDSKADEDSYYRPPTDHGGQLVYRVEERIIQKYLPGFQIWATGYFEDIASGDKNQLTGTNWLYFQYDPDFFTAQVRFGYDVANLEVMQQYGDRSRQFFSVKPSFFYKIFNNLLSAGLAFEYAKDFGSDPNKIVSQSYLYWYIEPQLRVNLNENTYLAFVYRYQDDYYKLDRNNNYVPFNSRTHWVNLRAVFFF